MTIVDKLSDRNGFIYEAILLVLNNKGFISEKKLQWDLFQCSVYIKKPLLRQALSVMHEKKIINFPFLDEKANPQKSPAIIQP